MRLYTNSVYIVDKSRLLLDVEAFFNVHSVKSFYLEDNITIIKRLEKGAYFGGNEFVDQFGRTLPLSNISTGTKAVLLSKNYPELIINYAEVGNNHLTYAAENIKDCTVFIVSLRMFFGNTTDNVSIIVNDELVFETISEFNESVFEGDIY